MPLRGDLKALGGFLQKLQKLPNASREIAVALAPKVSPLVGESFSAQAAPNGAAWPATKSGEPAFGGSDALGYVLSRLSGKASVRTTVLYPLHFHQDGTHSGGRKYAQKIRAAQSLRDRLRAALRPKPGAAPRKRKAKGDLSAQEFGERVREMEAKALQRAQEKRAKAELKAKNRAEVDAKVSAARSGVWDPPRPMIPDRNDPIPDAWNTTIRTTASEVMARYGATEK